MLFCISSPLIWAPSLGAQTSIPASYRFWVCHCPSKKLNSCQVSPPILFEKLVGGLSPPPPAERGGITHCDSVSLCSVSSFWWVKELGPGTQLIAYRVLKQQTFSNHLPYKLLKFSKAIYFHWSGITCDIKIRPETRTKAWYFLMLRCRNPRGFFISSFRVVLKSCHTGKCIFLTTNYGANPFFFIKTIFYGKWLLSKHLKHFL